MRDAVKRALPKDAPKPGKFRVRGQERSRRAAPGAANKKSRRADPVKFDITSLDGKSAGASNSPTRSSVSSRAGSDPAHGALAARQAPRRHAQGQEPRRHLAHRQENVQAEGHRRRPSRLGPRAAVPRRWSRLRSGCPRPTRTTCPRRSARLRLQHALSAKLRDGGIIVWDKADR